MNQGKVIVFAGPTGVGKDTIVKAIGKLINFYRPVNFTTRPPRPSEHNGVHYCFVDLVTFQYMNQQGEFLEVAKIHGHWYATEKIQIQDSLSNGKSVLIVVDPQGAFAIRQKINNTVLIYIQYDDGFALENQIRQRLITRTGVSEEEIERRIKTAQTEETTKHRFDHIVTNYNNDLVKTITEIEKIIISKTGKS